MSMTITLLTLMIWGGAGAAGQTVGKPGPAAPAPGDAIRVVDRHESGYASFVTARDGVAIPVARAVGQPEVRPIDFLRQHGALFGVSDPQRELTEVRTAVGAIGHTHTAYAQMYRGVPVFSGVLKVHQDAQGRVRSANGAFRPIADKLSTVPTLDEPAAIAAASAEMAGAAPRVDRIELVIVDPGWYGDPPRGAHLAYHVILSDMTVPAREAFFLDAHTGEILDQWSLIITARDRAVYDGMGGSGLPGTLARAEGDPPVGSPVDVNRAYDYAGDVYDYFFRAFGRDSIDDAGMTLILTVNSTAPPCPNAFWNGTQMVFCTGTVTDDVAAHEIVHGVTERTANLIYQNQSGQLNESYSDIFGELVDLFNGDAALPGPPGGPPNWPTHATGPGQDTPNNLRTGACSPATGYPDGVRWLVGEDATAFGGAIRDMWNPPCEGDPDRANSPLQTCNPFDSGGVHSGSGIPNHAFAILSDGKTFNGQTVTGIGVIKAAAVWYRALTVYLTPASDFRDAYIGLNQAAADLVGTTPNDPRTGTPSASAFTAADAAEVDSALLAVEMDTDGACGATVDILNPIPPVLCSPRTTIFADDFEGGAGGWTVALTGIPDTPYDWVLDSTLPLGRPGTGWFCLDLADGCPPGGEESAVHHLLSPTITMPAALGDPTLVFTHYLATEPGYDGCNVSIRVNGGPWNLVPSSAFLYNAYNTTINGGTNTNPLAGEPGWSGAGGGWGTSVVDLGLWVTGGEDIQFRFNFGKDYCNGVDGWYLDDVEVFICTCATDPECDDGLFCTGTESCVGGFCQATGNPCGADFCDEATNTCVAAAFVEDFESGNAQGWTLRGAGSTASTGDWVVGNPNGTFSGADPAQPEDPAAGSGCVFTAQNSSLGVDDVDNGVIYLESPTIDLSNAVSATLLFDRWHYNRDLGEDSGDFYVADASSDDGATWTNLETLDTTQRANTWTARSFTLDGVIAFTNTVRLRFGASDGAATGNIIESAVDNIVLTVVGGCSTPQDCTDGDVCNGAETCVGNVCQPGTPLTCDDGVGCTDDGCDPIGGCQFTPNDANCPDDGTFCNGTESCDAVADCVSSGDPCSAGAWCHEAGAACVPYGDGDFDIDGDVDMTDFAAFQVCFGGLAVGACEPGNMSGDGTIDLTDFTQFAGLLGGPL